jgi:hypothetical protein
VKWSCDDNAFYLGRDNLSETSRHPLPAIGPYATGPGGDRACCAVPPARSRFVRSHATRQSGLAAWVSFRLAPLSGGRRVGLAPAPSASHPAWHWQPALTPRPHMGTRHGMERTTLLDYYCHSNLILIHPTPGD